MTRATSHIPVSVPAPADRATAVEGVTPEPQSAALTSALRIAQLAALGLARGTGGAAKGAGATSLYLGRQGYLLAKKALARPAAAAPTLTLVTEPALASAPAAGRRGRTRRRVVLLALTGAAAAAVAVYVKKQRTELPPPAARPPSLSDFDNA
ncbi:hypothetical protein [Rhodococcus kronopolitis]|uniref:Uncharacterized protein n=1 Tax=Rhodococcus kronopolitis TaxID=1460226 RepID=A0ABV9FZM9_9NOCA